MRVYGLLATTSGKRVAHLGQRAQTATAAEQRLRVACTDVFGVVGASHEAVDGVLRAAEQDDLDEVGAPRARPRAVHPAAKHAADHVADFSLVRGGGPGRGGLVSLQLPEHGRVRQRRAAGQEPTR